MSKEISVNAAGTAGKMVVIDVHPGNEISEAILDACKIHHIRTGFVCYGIGSLKCAVVENVSADRSAITGVSCSKERSIDGPLQLLSAQGCIGLDDAGEPTVHLHAVFFDGNTGALDGGHLLPGTTYSVNRLELGILDAQGLEVTYKIDPRTGYNHVIPKTL